MRSQFCNVIISAEGHGKTTLCQKIAIAVLKSNPAKRVLFIVSDKSEKDLQKIPRVKLADIANFNGVGRCIVSNQDSFKRITDLFGNGEEDEEEEEEETNDFRFNGLIIADDLSDILTARPKAVINMMRKRRHANLEIIFCFHGLHCDTPTGFFGRINKIILGRTADAHEDFIKKLPMHKRVEFMEIYDRVQTITETDPFYYEELEINPLKYY